MTTKKHDRIIVSFYSLMPRGTSFLCAEKAGSKADSTAGLFPGPRQCLRIGPGLIKTEMGNRRQGDVPLEPQITGRFPFEGNRQERGHPNERPYRKGP